MFAICNNSLTYSYVQDEDLCPGYAKDEDLSPGSIYQMFAICYNSLTNSYVQDEDLCPNFMSKMKLLKLSKEYGWNLQDLVLLLTYVRNWQTVVPLSEPEGSTQAPGVGQSTPAEIATTASGPGKTTSGGAADATTPANGTGIISPTDSVDETSPSEGAGKTSTGASAESSPPIVSIGTITTTY